MTTGNNVIVRYRVKVIVIYFNNCRYPHIYIVMVYCKIDFSNFFLRVVAGGDACTVYFFFYTAFVKDIGFYFVYHLV